MDTIALKPEDALEILKKSKFQNLGPFELSNSPEKISKIEKNYGKRGYVFKCLKYDFYFYVFLDGTVESADFEPSAKTP